MYDRLSRGGDVEEHLRRSVLPYRPRRLKVVERLLVRVEEADQGGEGLREGCDQLAVVKRGRVCAGQCVVSVVEENRSGMEFSTYVGK